MTANRRHARTANAHAFSPRQCVGGGLDIKLYVAFVLVGVATSFYILGTLVSFVAEGGFRQRRRRQRMEREIARLHDHFIVCGYGRVGRQIVAEFAREDVSFVVIDAVPESLAVAEAEGHCVITGSPASDEVLHHARLEAARGLIAAMDNDAENVYVTLPLRYNATRRWVG